MSFHDLKNHVDLTFNWRLLCEPCLWKNNLLFLSYTSLIFHIKAMHLLTTYKKHRNNLTIRDTHTMEHKISIMLLFIAGALIIDSSTGLSPPPPPSPSVDPTCFPELLTCQGTDPSKPSVVCCASLKDVYEKQIDCLCLVAMSQNLTKQLGFNSTQISTLLVNCKVMKDSTGFCNATSPIAAPPLPFTPGSPFPFPPPGLLTPRMSLP